MKVDIKGVHLEIPDSVRDYIGKKMGRIDFVRDSIVDLLFTITQERSAYKLEVNINFRWSHSIHVGADSFDINEGIDKLFDKMELKIIKEKKKVQEHKGQESVRTGETPTEETEETG
jgi:putative sigma-54 modulation protein